MEKRLSTTNAVVTTLATSPNHGSENSIVKCGRNVRINDETELTNYTALYIGAEGPTLTNLIMTLSHCEFYSYNPSSRLLRKESVNVNRALMKRFYLVEKVKDARIVGIVAGTLGVSDYMSVIARLKTVLKTAGKKYYTFVMGKLNVPKMANFMEIDAFVLVACPQNSLLDSSEFYKPIVTPYEVELACNPDREWVGRIVSDFRQLLPGIIHRTPLTVLQYNTRRFLSRCRQVPLFFSNRPHPLAFGRW